VGALVVCWALFSGWTTVLESDLREMVYARRGGPATRHPATPLAGVVTADDTVFSEDPWVEVSRGKTPTILDPFTLAMLTRKHPELTAPLVQRVRAGEFSKVVLLRRLGSTSSQDWHVYYERHLGGPVVRAITERYELLTESEGYFVYVPRRAVAEALDE
jgi:hypothetical protein